MFWLFTLLKGTISNKKECSLLLLGPVEKCQRKTKKRLLFWCLTINWIWAVNMNAQINNLIFRKCINRANRSIGISWHRISVCWFRWVSGFGVFWFVLVFFLKKSCKDDLLVPIPCTQYDSYQAQNNFSWPVTTLTFHFEAEQIHSQLSEGPARPVLALLKYKNMRRHKSKKLPASVPSSRFSILSMEEIPAWNRTVLFPDLLSSPGLVALVPINISSEHGFEDGDSFPPEIKYNTIVFLYRSSKQLLNFRSFQPLLLWVRFELMTHRWKAWVTFQSPESFRLPANA